MKNTLNKYILSVYILFSGLYAYSQNSESATNSGYQTRQEPFSLYNYEELDNPAPTDLASWKRHEGTSVYWGSRYIRYSKEVLPRNLYESIRQLTGWKGERVAAQLLISSTTNLEDVVVEVGDLIHVSGTDRIMAENIHGGFVRYVMTDELNKDKKGTCGYRPDLSVYDSTLVADPIDHWAGSLPIEAYTTQGYWLRVWIPQDALAGKYVADVTVKNEGKPIKTLKLIIQVLEHTLPEPKYWSFHLDLWQNPFAVSRYYNVQPWTDEHFRLLKQEMKLYADAGGKVITVPIMHEPWNAQTYDPYQSMITWIKRVDGSWLFDYTIFNRWVELMMSLGIKKGIGCYTMIPWKASYQYFDQATNSMKKMVTKPGEKEYHDLWLNMLKDFAKHLRMKGWFDITYIAMDERSMKDMTEALAVIHEADPDFKVSLAGALHVELSDRLDDHCVAFGTKYPEEIRLKRKQEGKVTTYYTCCTESYPNTYTFSSPAESEWLGWYAIRMGLDGYLRWAYNSWTTEPLLDSRFYCWGAGDTYLVYPGGRSSIRFENLVAGIQAYEKVAILCEEFRKKGRVVDLKRIEKMLRMFDEGNLAKTSADVVVEKANRFINRF